VGGDSAVRNVSSDAKPLVGSSHINMRIRRRIGIFAS
jgi:hypothetical protein